MLIHISTDYVFNGAASTPYLEVDAVHPLGVYGASKLAGEVLAAKTHDKTVIIRTSWVYSYYGKNFVKTMLRLLKEKDTLGVVNDQLGRPTYAADLAKAMLDITTGYSELSIARRSSDARFNGIYHYADHGVISWYDLTVAIRKHIKSPCVVKPISTAEYPTPAKRPAWSVLDTAKIKAAFGVQIPDWRKSLEVCLDRLLESPE